MQKRGGSGLELHSTAADQHLATADHRFGTSFCIILINTYNKRPTDNEGSQIFIRIVQKDVPNWRSASANCSMETLVLHHDGMSTQQSRPQALQQRLISHAAILLDISSKLPPTPQATHISRQLLRSGTAAAANYGEARGAESRSDFIHKLRVVLKELNETDVWLQLIVTSSLLSPESMSAIVAENQELCRIIAASIKTAGGFERT
jgi:four helix bundle protein